MADLDARIQAALRDQAHDDDVAPDVFERVAAKRVHRRRVRRAQQGAVALAVVLGIVAVSLVAVTNGSDDHGTRVAAPPGPSLTPKARLTGPDGTARVPVHFVGLDEDEGYVRAPIVAQGGQVTAAAYDRTADGYSFPPSRIVRFTTDGHVVDRIDLQGEILSLAQGEGARWALTHDKEVLAPPDPEFRVKRIGPTGDVASNAVPRGEQPAGEIFAGGGAVWLPVTDGVLRFDTATGQYAGKIDLQTTFAHRAMTDFGKGAVVTDGTLLRRLDPFSETADPLPGTTAPPGLEYRDITAAQTNASAWAIGTDTSGMPFLWEFSPFGAGGGTRVSGPAPQGAYGFVTAGGDSWLELLVRGEPALQRFDGPTADPSTLTTRAVVDGSIVPVDGDTAVVTSRGRIYRMRLDR